MELIHEILYAVVCVEIFLCVQGQVTFNPDAEVNVPLQVTPITPPLEVTTVQCYSSSPIFKIQYVTPIENDAVYEVHIPGSDDSKGSPANGNACMDSKQKYIFRVNNLRFIADPLLVGGTFKLKATLDNNEANSTISRTNYTFAAPFNLTGSSMSALLGSDFTWTCHVTSDYPVIEWYRGSTNLRQIGILNEACVTFGQNDSYIYNCQRSALTYTLTIPGSNLTEELQGTIWRCRDATTEVKGSEFIKLDIVVPVTSVTMSPGGNGSTFNADENDMATFTCTTNSANPPPTILWYIGSSDVTSMAGSNRTTLPVNVNRTYNQIAVKCVARNSGNTANLSDSSIFNVIFPPANNEDLQLTGYNSGQVLYENSTAMVEIFCSQPGGNPLVNMTFKCGSQTGTNESTASEAIRKVSLTINRSLDGTQCVCASTHINAYMRRKSVTFTVYYPPSTPFISISSAFPWKANDTQRLKCETTQGNPAATTYIWEEGGSMLPITSQTYEFNPVQPTDNGRQLHCQVNNNFTLQQNVVLISDVTNLHVEYPPANNEELQITGYTSGQVLYENDPPMVSIHCRQTGGNPVVNMTFTCGSQTGTNGNTNTEAIRRVNLTNSRNLNGLQCVCTSTHINAYIRSKDVSFIVYYPPSTPTINLSSALPWKATGTYNLTCNRTPGNPADTIYTWKDGVSVSQITSQTYEFKPLNSTDNGRKLSCQVNNNFTLHKSVVLTSNVTTLQVEYDPDVTLDQRSVEVIEGRTAVLRCSATGNPLPTVTWYRDSTPVTESTISSSTYTITNTRRTLTGNYTCKATSSSAGSNILQPDEMNARLRVFYPPTVQIYFQNTTENTRNHTIRCSAEGDPNNSKFVALHQMIESTLIRNITDFTESSPGNITLTIPRVSYQEMGTYTCLASNGIPDRSNQMVQLDSGYFNVITSAKFEMEQYIVRSDIDKEAVVRIPFYRNPPATETDVVWTRYTGSSNETLDTSANLSLSLNDADVQQTFYGVEVTLRGQSATMDITSFQNIYEGNYTLKIRSSHTDNAEVRIALIRSGPPDTPSDFQLLNRKVTSIVLTWNKGSDGGHPQTFVILYREETSEIYTIKQLEDTTMNRNITHEIKSLQPGTSYEFLLYSFNEKGNSTSHRPLEESTLKVPEEPSLTSLNSGLVGGAAGGGAAVLVVVIVIIVVVMRRRHYHGKGNDSKGILNSKEMLAGTSRQNDYDDGEDGLKDNPLYGSGASGTSGTSGTNAVQGAGAAPENPSLYAEVVKPKKKYPAKVSEDPPPIYAEVDKSNKKGKGPLKPKRKSSTKGGEDPPPIYAEVNKPNKKGDKGKQKQQKAKGKIEGDVYENVGGFKEKETQFIDPAVKQETKGNEPRGYRNQDGLLYVDVKFDQPPPTGKPVIRGEERTGYAMIEFEEPPTFSTADDVKGAEGGI